MSKPALALLIAATTLAAPAAHADEALMEKSGCIACHRVDSKLIGPAFKDVAARYRAEPDAAAYLAGKIRNGSEDVWGDLPMPPKAVDKLPDEDIRRIVEWLLKL